jgi:3',5'-cyclic AMP phosphodiesterase CpdA
VPGNHDVPLYRVFERLFRPHDLYREYICDELNRAYRVQGAVIVALDSTAPHTAITGGRISAAQLEFASQIFDGAPPDSVKVVVAHHHFAPAPDYEHDSAMPRARRAMQRFVELGVDLILGGHLHRSYIGNSLDILPGPVSNRGVIIVQSGTTTSGRGRARERQRNSLNMIQVDGNTFRITHYMYFDDVDGFQPVSYHEFPRAGRRLLQCGPDKCGPANAK